MPETHILFHVFSEAWNRPVIKAIVTALPIELAKEHKENKKISKTYLDDDQINVFQLWPKAAGACNEIAKTSTSTQKPFTFVQSCQSIGRRLFVSVMITL